MKVAVVAVAAGIAALVMAVAVLAGIGGSSSAAAVELGQTCTVTGPVPGLTPAQAANADSIVTATFAAAAESQRAAQIALMTAVTESGLNNDGPGVGGDGSVGLFQQRSSQGWGTVAQEENPADATRMFVARLIQVPAWETMPPWVAAQQVQRSAFADGSNYQANWAKAGVYLARVLSDGNQPGSCGQGIPNGITGGAHGLPTGYSIPAGTGPEHASAVAYALAQIGKPYVWGAAGPSSFDCSGLTMAAWATAGVALQHYTGDQQSEGVAVSQATLEAGDLVLVPGSDSPGPGIAGHVGLYLGFGLVLSAIDVAEGVAVQSWQSFTSGGLDALRDPAPGA